MIVMSMYWMDSATFMGVFLTEDPKKILNAQYVIVSQNISHIESEFKNIINASSQLYPNPNVFIGSTSFKDKEFREKYESQLDDAKAFLAALIKGVIEEGYTVIFLCTYDERKNIGYIKLLANYIISNFVYPVYDYHKYRKGKQSLARYNRKYVLKICDEILDNERVKQHDNMLKSKAGRKKFVDNMSKSELKRLYKKIGISCKYMSKKEMKKWLYDNYI